MLPVGHFSSGSPAFNYSNFSGYYFPSASESPPISPATLSPLLPICNGTWIAPGLSRPPAYMRGGSCEQPTLQWTVSIALNRA